MNRVPHSPAATAAILYACYPADRDHSACKFLQWAAYTWHTVSVPYVVCLQLSGACWVLRGSPSLSQALWSSTGVNKPLLGIALSPQAHSSSLSELQVNLLLPSHPSEITNNKQCSHLGSLAIKTPPSTLQCPYIELCGGLLRAGGGPLVLDKLRIFLTLN